MTGRKRRQLRTADYSDEARERLGDAVAKARAAAGYETRPPFATALSKSVRTIDALERGEPTVGQAALFAVGRLLPTWTEETPRIILEAGPIPPNPEPGAPRPTSKRPPHEWSAEARRKMVGMTMQEILAFVDNERVMRGDAAAEETLEDIMRVRKEAKAIPIEVDQPPS